MSTRTSPGRHKVRSPRGHCIPSRPQFSCSSLTNLACSGIMLIALAVQVLCMCGRPSALLVWARHSSDPDALHGPWKGNHCKKGTQAETGQTGAQDWSCALRITTQPNHGQACCLLLEQKKLAQMTLIWAGRNVMCGPATISGSTKPIPSQFSQCAAQLMRAFCCRVE